MIQKRSRSLNKMKNTLTVAILVVGLKTGSGLLNQKPQDSVAIAGKSAYFNCSTSDPSMPILWYHYATKEVHRKTIYQFANFTDYWYPCYRKGRYVVEKNPATGSFNLVIPMVLLSDAGRYLCEVDGDEGVATLTVQAESSSMFVASEMCKPYIKPYSNALICIILIVLPISIGITIFVMWYLRDYRPNKQKQKEDTGDQEHVEPEATTVNQHLLPDISETIHYADKPKLVNSIQLTGKSKGKSINGITILSNELFVVTERSNKIEVYDSTTLKRQPNIEVREMPDPLDIASSKDANCLYIVGRFSEKTESQIVRIDLGGKVLKQWSTGGRKGRLSAYGSNVILCLSDKQLIIEYSPDGTPVVTIPLSPAVKLNNPLHAIKVTSTCFVVSHGYFKDELQRVCLVDLEGNIKKDRMVDFPICLVEDNGGSIIVANQHNNRILLLGSMLKHQGKLIDEEQIPRLKGSPVRLCFQDIQSNLFIAVNRWICDEETWKDGHILIFNVKKKFTVCQQVD